MSTPYFYIILQKSTNKLYAGSRWSKNCNPDELFKTYFTSSNSIHNIIKKCGKADFQILKINLLLAPKTFIILDNTISI